MIPPHRIAVLVPNFLGVTRAVLGGIGQYTREHDPWVIVNNPWQVAERGLTLPRQPIDGAILCFPDILRNRRIPTVLLTERFVDAPLPRIIADSAAIGRLAAEHLLDCGLRHLAFIGYAGAAFAQRRGAGFVQAAEHAGLTCHVFGAHNQDRRFPGAAVRRWLRALPKPLGLMTCNDHLGVLMLGVCHELGLRVPADVAIVGVDNDELVCDFCAPPLSSVQLDSRNAGYRAAQLLHGLLRGRKAPARAIVIRPLGVVRRQSSDIVAIGGEVVGRAIKFMRDHACRGISVAEVARQTTLARPSCPPMADLNPPLGDNGRGGHQIGSPGIVAPCRSVQSITCALASACRAAYRCSCFIRPPIPRRPPPKPPSSIALS